MRPFAISRKRAAAGAESEPMRGIYKRGKAECECRRLDLLEPTPFPHHHSTERADDGDWAVSEDGAEPVLVRKADFEKTFKLLKKIDEPEVGR